MRKIQLIALVISICLLGSTGLPQSRRQKRNTPLANGRYRAKRTPWKGPTSIKAVNLKLLATLYGDVSNSNGTAVPDDVIQNFDLSPDGNTLVCAYFPATLIVWNTRTGTRKKIIELASPGFGDVVFAPDGAAFVTGPGNMAQEKDSHTVTFWDAKTYKVIGKIHSSGIVESVKFSPDGKSLALATFIDDPAGEKTIVELWDVHSKKLAAVQPAKGRLIGGSSLYIMSRLAFSPDSGKLATITKQSIELWDLKTGQLSRTLEVTKGDPTGLWFSPDGQFLASTSELRSASDQDPVGELIIWNLADGEKRSTLPDFNYATFTPDGKLIASGNKSRDYSLIDVTTGKIVSHFPLIGALRFSRNGKVAASYDELVVIRTWDVLK
jgi:WD40 repeat protein